MSLDHWDDNGKSSTTTKEIQCSRTLIFETGQKIQPIFIEGGTDTFVLRTEMARLQAPLVLWHTLDHANANTALHHWESLKKDASATIVDW